MSVTDCYSHSECVHIALIWDFVFVMQMVIPRRTVRYIIMPLLRFSFVGETRLDLWHNRLGILETAILSDP